MKAYPKWLYHPLKPPCVVADEAEHKALGDGWVESPADTKAGFVHDSVAAVRAMREGDDDEPAPAVTVKPTKGRK